MRILFDARSVRTPAGLNVCRGLVDGWRADPSVERVYVATRNAEIRPHIPDIDIITLESSTWLTHLLVELPRLIERLDVDVCFAANGMAPPDKRAVLYLQDLHCFRIPPMTALSAQRNVRKFIQREWIRYLGAFAGLAVGVSRDIAAAAGRCISTPIVTIPNGVDVGAARWHGRDNVIFVMGGTGARKAESLAVRSVAELKRKGMSVALKIVGVEPAVRRSELVSLAESLRILDRVTVRGMVDHASYVEEMCCARIVVSCTSFEAFSLPVAEAIAVGAPVVCSDIPAHREILESAHAGTTFATGDFHALTDALVEALRSGVARCESMPIDWGWRARAAQHVAAYTAHMRTRPSHRSSAPGEPLPRTSAVADA